MLQADGSIAKPRNENFSPILMPPEFAKGKLKLENAGFDDIDAFIPSMIWLAGHSRKEILKYTIDSHLIFTNKSINVTRHLDHFCVFLMPFFV